MGHPATRIITLLVLCTAVALGELIPVFVGLALVAAVFIVADVRLAPAWRTLKRLRWFLISIAITYLWFTPGAPLFPSADSSLTAWLPTIEGLIAGALRALALATIVSSVNVLTQTTEKTELLAGIFWLLAPLKFVGVEHERLAVRVALVMATVEKIPPLVQQTLVETEVREQSAWRRLARAAQFLYERTLKQAQNDHRQNVEIAVIAGPRISNWSLPLATALILLAAHLLENEIFHDEGFDD